MRDDHDSSKKRGQWDNFVKKYNLLKTKNPNATTIAIIWFSDASKKKNKNYYKEMITKAKNNNIKLFYGDELFTDIFFRPDIWEEINTYLGRNKEEGINKKLNVPNFDTGKRVLPALEKFQKTYPKNWKRMTNPEDKKYGCLCKELFPTRKNIKIIESKFSTI